MHFETRTRYQGIQCCSYIRRSWSLLPLPNFAMVGMGHRAAEGTLRKHRGLTRHPCWGVGRMQGEAVEHPLEAAPKLHPKETRMGWAARRHKGLMQKHRG